ncbi:MAG: amidohydrolase [Woeseia sp.]
MSPLTVAIIQAPLEWHAAAANRATFAEKIAALESATDLIVLPEMFTTGFTMAARQQAESMDGPSVTWLQDMAKQTGAAVCGSLVIRDGEKFFNRFVMAMPDGSRHCYDKRHLFRLAGECEHYSAGTELLTVELKGWRVRPFVCYDLRFPVWSRRSPEQDFDLLLFVANWPSPRHQAWEVLLRARAIENQCYVVGVNRVGKDGNDLGYAGGSVIIDFFGNELVNLGDREAAASATLDAQALKRFRERFPFDMDADTFSVSSAPPAK